MRTHPVGQEEALTRPPGNPAIVMQKASAARLLVLSLMFALSQAASAHGGGLNADGCHVNRKTGDYHCHRSASRQSLTPDAYATARNGAPLTSASNGARSVPAFANCAEARAAGAAPVRLGEPGYGAHLDRDNDGIGCESSRRQR